MSICHGTRIKELRTIAGMSQEELGRRVGVQRAAINKYEKGTVTNIPLQTIEKIAYVLDVSPTYIVGWDEENVRSPLSMEVKVIQGVKKFFGIDAVHILENYMHLTPKGKRRVYQYAEDMLAIFDNEELI